jgi:DNA-binding Xre family transcriptional regulator
MPRVAIYSDKKNVRELPNIIKAMQGYYRMTNKDVATAVGVTERTMSSRYHNPEQFTLEQLHRLCKKLKFEIVINENGVKCRLKGAIVDE